MEFIITVIIFVIVLFLYVHIIDQYKRSEDLEIYEMDYVNNAQFQETCDVKQPVLFEFKQMEPEIFDEMQIETISKITNDDIKVLDSQDYYKETETVDYIALPFQSAQKLIETDTNSHFFTEHNQQLMDETGLSAKILETFDTHFKPFATIQSQCDFIFGSKGAYTPLRYHTDYRQLLCVSSGKIQVKMTPWKSNKYLSPVKDYEKYEFRSPVNAWTPQKQYLHEMDKLRFLEFEVLAGHLLYIPAYWWYSIKYTEGTAAFTCTYNTVINRIANIPDIVMYMLQQQNITKIYAAKKPTHVTALDSLQEEVEEFKTVEIEDDDSKSDNIIST